MKTPIVFIFNFLFLLTVGITQAQVKDGKHDKLFDLFVMDDYEKCISRCQKMMEDEEYRKDPEPLLYMSMALLQIYYDIDNYDPVMYKNALKDAVKYATKARKKDKDTTLYNANRAFFEEVKKEGVLMAKDHFLSDSYRKSASVYKTLVKLDPNDPWVLYLKGVSDMMAVNVGEGKMALDAAVPKMLEDPSSIKKTSSTVQIAVLEAVLIYSEHLRNKEDGTGAAKETISMGKQLFADNEKVVTLYEELHQ